MDAKLTAIGFEKLPSFDSEYFRYRKKIGFLVLLNVKTKQCYSVFTINAITCLQSAIRLVKGEYADRARDLEHALKLSALYDWEVYFNKNTKGNELRESVEGLLEGYTSLNTFKSRLDQTEPTWAYSVVFKPVQRTFVVTSRTPLDKSGAISAFLLKWKSSLESTLNRASISVQEYYVDSNHLGIATNYWLSSKTGQFEVTPQEHYAGKPRKQVCDFASRTNMATSLKYRTKLQIGVTR